MKNVLMIGMGRFGRYTARKLNEFGHDVMAVDKDEERINKVMDDVASARIGDATSSDFLRTLGIKDFDLCIVAVGDAFLEALEITSLVKELGAQKVISRATSATMEKFLLRNGADDVVYPEKQLASWMVMRHVTDHVLDYIALDSNYGIYDMSVPPEWNGRTVGELDIRKRYNLNILAIRDPGKSSMYVNSETVLRESQTILVLGTWKEIQKCFRL